MSHNYRLYTFVAGLYLSDLQKGLQTAHVVSELHTLYRSYSGADARETAILDEWAELDKTIIILSAENHAGVENAFNMFGPMAMTSLRLPMALFYEDKASMNGMATACGVIVPQVLWDVTYTPSQSFAGPDGQMPCWKPAFYQHIPLNGDPTIIYGEGSVEFSFCKLLKSFRFA